MLDPVKLEHFRNLISLSAADGKIEESERRSLTRIASALGIPDERLNVMLTHAREYRYLVPQNSKDRDQQLKDMIGIALVDGEFARPERDLVKAVAKKPGFSAEEAEQFISKHLAKR